MAARAAGFSLSVESKDSGGAFVYGERDCRVCACERERVSV